MAKLIRRKIQVNSTISPILAKKLDEGVEAETYSSQSDAVSIALAEHFVREEQRQKEKKMAELYSVLIQREEGRELLDEVPRTPKEIADALTKAGIAHVEAGEYEEAKKCFAKVRELEGKDSPNTQKVAEAKGCYKTLLSEEEEEPEEETVEEQLRKDKVPKTATRRVVIE
jgi:metal-responsive CopG/Arc/MetJ family transcriptional regulator